MGKGKGVCVCVAVCALGGGSGRQIESSLLERGTMRPQTLSYLLFLFLSFPFFSFLFLSSVTFLSFPFLFSLISISFQNRFSVFSSFSLYISDFFTCWSHLSLFLLSVHLICFLSTSLLYSISLHTLLIFPVYLLSSPLIIFPLLNHIVISTHVSLHMHVWTVGACVLCSHHADMQMPFIHSPWHWS